MGFDRSEFLSTFHDEAKDHLQKLNEGLLLLEKDPANSKIIEEMFREGHTLKGAARMMGFDEIKEISHCIEDIFGAIHNQKLILDQDMTTLLFEGLDAMGLILEEVISGKPVSYDWKTMADKLKVAFESALGGDVNQEAPEETDSDPKKKKIISDTKSKKSGKKSVKKPPVSSGQETSGVEFEPASLEAHDSYQEKFPKSDDTGEEEQEEEPETELTFEEVRKELEKKGLLNVPLTDYTSEKSPLESLPQSQTTSSENQPQTIIEEFIKVPLTKINILLNLVGEMVINKINSNQKITGLRRLSRLSRSSQKRLNDLLSSVNNRQEVHAFPVLNEIKGELSELNNELQHLKEDISLIHDEISMEVSQLDPIVDELQLRMKQIRMLPVGSIFEAMPRLVRDIAVAQGKKIDLHISGEETELDKKVLECIKGGLIHLLRNSVDHGIEMPADRVAAGKSERGNINLRAFHKGGNVIIEIEDDGRGLKITKIKETAIRKGLISQQDVARLSEKEIINFVFYPGFSTAPIITDISGRGVGLDVVKTEIESLKGIINIESQPNKGTKFILQLPLTVAIIQALLVRCQGSIFAIPLLSVEESISLNRNEINTLENRAAIRIRNRTISVVSLTEILNVPRLEKRNNQKKHQSGQVSIVILNMMEKLLGLEVDEIIGEQEIFIKSLDDKLGKLKNVSGATVLGSGEVIVILDILDLFDSSKLVTTYAASDDAPKAAAKKVVMGKHILVAEDSLTTRELERSILESHGYVVDTAIDGLDALNKVQSNNYDLVVSDIEMPKMEGFELCKAIRQNPDLKDIPVIIVTSLDREEDKRRGIEVGAQAYIVKSAFDQSALVDTVKRLIG